METGYLAREDEFIGWSLGLFYTYIFVLFLGVVWFIAFRFQAKSASPFPVVLAPSFRRCLYYSSLFIVIHFVVQQVSMILHHPFGCAG